MITICTPTYNREHTLEQLYISLIKQENKNFEWLIIDDGSTDNTKNLVERFMKENEIVIKYYYQENQGKHIALNLGQELASYELFFCLDSDDWIISEAIEMILKDYKFIKYDETIAGLIYLDKFSNGEVVGSNLLDKETVNWLDLIYKYKMTGDKCYIFKTEIIRKYPFKSFENNNHMPPSYQYYKLSEHYNLFTINTAIKVVEYLDDGISKNIFKKYYTASENYTYYRKTIHSLIPSRVFKFKNSLHYNITKINSRKLKDLDVHGNSQRLMNNITYPFSILINILLKSYVKRRLK